MCKHRLLVCDCFDYNPLKPGQRLHKHRNIHKVPHGMIPCAKGSCEMRAPAHGSTIEVPALGAEGDLTKLGFMEVNEQFMCGKCAGNATKRQIFVDLFQGGSMDHMIHEQLVKRDSSQADPQVQSSSQAQASGGALASAGQSSSSVIRPAAPLTAPSTNQTEVPILNPDGIINVEGLNRKPLPPGLDGPGRMDPIRGGRESYMDWRYRARAYHLSEAELDARWAMVAGFSMVYKHSVLPRGYKAPLSGEYVER